MNFGLKIEPLKPEDHVLGGTLGAAFPTINEKGDWTGWLPVPEMQNHGTETNACVSFATTNIAETLIRFTFGYERNLSDRFLAKISNTDTKGGNSPQVVAQAVRDNGCANEIDWPYTNTDYYISLPSWIRTLARAFNTEYELRYKFVPSTPEAITEALKSSPLLFSVHAWVKDGDVYYRPQGATDNHAVMCFKEDKDYYYIFDSYSNDGTVIKRVKKSSIPQVVYVYQISRRIVVESWWDKFLTWLTKAAYGV